MLLANYVSYQRKHLLLLLAVFLSHYLFAIPPTITSFSPTRGPVGTSVTISGANFNLTAANNIVYFGAVKATVTAATATSLIVTVPVGCTYGPVTVTTGGLTAYSSIPFCVTFSTVSSITKNSYNQKFDFSTGSHPWNLSIADMDGDGKADMSATNNGAGTGSTFSILKNTSVGEIISFDAKTDITTDIKPLGISTGDLNGDGKTDIVITYSGSAISVFKNNSTLGTIAMGSKQNFTTGNISGASALINDIDGDGKPDIALTSESNAGISILRNTSTTGAISFATYTSFAVGLSIQQVALSDFDGDGKADLILSNAGISPFTSFAISVLRNTSTAGSISFATIQDFPVSGIAADMSLCDLDGDGKLDITISDFSIVSCFRNTSANGTLSIATQQDFTTTANPYHIVFGDLDGDGKPDMAIENSNQLDLYKNISTEGSISFGKRVYAISTVLLNYPPLALGDLEGDGRLDFAIVKFGSDVVSVYKNQMHVPVISSFTPTSGPSGSTVTITGSYLTDASAVSFGGVPANSFTAESSTTITAVIGAGQSGSISITTPEGVITHTGFTFVPPSPTITSFEPSTAKSGTVITITGINFTSATAVSFGDVMATSFTVISSTTIKATIATAASGRVSVTTPSGTATQDGFIFTPDTVTATEVDMISDDKLVEVFPNPTDGKKIHLSFNVAFESKTATIEVVDVTGEKVHSSYLICQPITTVDISPDKYIRPGLYFVALTIENRKIMRKLFVKDSSLID